MAEAPAPGSQQGQAPPAQGQVPEAPRAARAPRAQASAEAARDVPRKRINTLEDLRTFAESKVCAQLMSFVGELSEAVRGTAQAPERLDNASPVVRGLVSLLEELERWVQDFPPLAQPMRFGNKAFRKWHDRLEERGADLLRDVIAQAPAAAAARAQPLAAEVSRYFCGAFGDERRIDYGTGHEAAFLAFLFALGSAGAVAKADAADLVLLVFARYIRVMRRLQTVYVLEPAGSHGVWGLDDFHALPFLWGAAQLTGMEEDVPTGEVYRDRILREYADRFLYVNAIQQVLLAKRGAPFHETSPMLYDITAVPTWQKTHAGLVKMYRAEVLGKFPVIQHFLFGPMIPWPGDELSAPAAS